MLVTKGTGRRPGAHSGREPGCTPGCCFVRLSARPPAPTPQAASRCGARNHTPRRAGHSLDPHVLFKSRLGNCLNVVWDMRPHHIDERNKQEHFSLPSFELKWHIKTCHGFSLGLETSFLHPACRQPLGPARAPGFSAAHALPSLLRGPTLVGSSWPSAPAWGSPTTVLGPPPSLGTALSVDTGPIGHAVNYYLHFPLPLSDWGCIFYICFSFYFQRLCFGFLG